MNIKKNENHHIFGLLGVYCGTLLFGAVFSVFFKFLFTSGQWIDRLKCIRFDKMMLNCL